MAQVYDPEELKEAEQSAHSPGSLSTSTSPGKVTYSSGGSKASSPAVPQPEKSLYNSSATAPGRLRFGNFFQRRRNKFIVGGAVTALVGGVSITIFLSLLPLKILSIVNDLESHFFATSENAVTNEVDTMMSGYLQKYVLPGLKKCGSGSSSSTIDKSCNPIAIAGTSPVSNLYKAWKNARLENTLAEKYGTEFRYNSKSGRYYIKSPYLSQDIEITDFAEGKVATLAESAGWKEVSRKEFSSFFSGFHKNLEDETRLTQVMYRFKMTGLLHKYGSTRCIVSCDGRKSFKDTIANKKKAAQIKLAQRVIEPQSQELGIIIECIIAGCDINPDTQHAGLNGEPRSPAEVKLQDKLAELAAQEGSEATLDTVAQAVKDINEKGWTKYAMGELFAYIVGQAGGDEAAQQSARELGQEALGPVGWVLLASQLINGLNKAGPTIKELGYAMNSAAYAKTYLTYRTYADEIKTGNVDPTMVGSFIDSLGAGSHCFDGGSLDKNNACSNGEAQLGGTAEAEQTPLYQALINGQTNASSKNYICKNGQPVPAGQLVCSEEQLDKGNHSLDSIHNFLNLPIIGQVTNLAGFINDFTFKLMKPFGWLAKAFGLIPGVSSLVNKITSAVSSLISPLFKDLVSELIDIPVSTNMSGGRTFDAMAGGADVAGNDFSHHELGGTELTNQQVNGILTDQTNQALQNYQNESFFARMFDTSSTYSPISKLAMALPIGMSSFQANMSSYLSNPFGKLAGSFGVIFKPGHALAATTLSSDPFGITQYGYPSDDPIFNTDAETYWNQHCQDSTYTDAWNKYSISNLNPDTYQTENPQQAIPNLVGSDPKGTDPCLLIQAAVGSAGAIFPGGASLLTPDDTSD